MTSRSLVAAHMPALVKALALDDQAEEHQWQSEEVKEEESLGNATIDSDIIVAPAPPSLLTSPSAPTSASGPSGTRTILVSMTDLAPSRLCFCGTSYSFVGTDITITSRRLQGVRGEFLRQENV